MKSSHYLSLVPVLLWLCLETAFLARIEAADRPVALTDTSGKTINVVILGVSRDGETIDLTITRVEDTFVHVRFEDQEKVFVFPVSRLNGSSKRKLQETLVRLANPSGDPIADDGQIKLLIQTFHDAEKSQTNPDDVSRLLREAQERIPREQRSSPNVKFAIAVIDACINRPCADDLDGIVRKNPYHWDAWKLAVRQSTHEKALESGVARLKSMAKKVVECYHEAGPEESTFEAAAWVVEAVTAFSADEELKPLVEQITAEPSFQAMIEAQQDILKQREAAIQAEAAQLARVRKAEMEKKAQEGIALFEEVFGAMQQEYNSAEMLFNQGLPEYQRLQSEADRERQIYEAAQRITNAALAVEQTANERIQDIRKTIEELRADNDDGINDDLIESEKKLLSMAEKDHRDAQAARRDAERSEAGARETYAAAEGAASSYYLSVLEPQIVRMRQVELRAVAFLAEFRKEYGRIFSIAPELQAAFDKLGGWVDSVRQNLIGVARFRIVLRNEQEDEEQKRLRERIDTILQLLPGEPREYLQKLADSAQQP